jgi:hypothetical protein
MDNSSRWDGIVEKAANLAYDYEVKYFGCSQTTLAGLIEAFGIGGPDLLRASTCLAGGTARRGHVCGALTGGLIMIGYLTGRDDLEMFSQYQRGWILPADSMQDSSRSLVRSVVRRSRKLNSAGHSTCRTPDNGKRFTSGWRNFRMGVSP